MIILKTEIIILCFSPESYGGYISDEFILIQNVLVAVTIDGNYQVITLLSPWKW